MISSQDAVWMSEAVDLAQQGVGCTRPNPPVGSVVVKNGRVIGEGFHKKAGAWHAERLALKQAGSKAKGATCYITLEPCSTHGRTPPCTEAILQSGISRVVVGCLDPNPAHAGRGLDQLGQAGIETAHGILEATCAELIAPFARWICTGQPLLTLKLGTTLDGRIADVRGNSRWITGPQSRAFVQGLRRASDAILIGSETAIRDNPSLLPVPANGRTPYRIILDRRGRCPANLKVFSDAHRRRTVLVTCELSERKEQQMAKQGVCILRLNKLSSARDFERLKTELGKRHIMSILCEGGGVLAETLIRYGQVDRLVNVMAPRLLGGQGRASIGGKGWALSDMPHCTVTAVKQLGDDVCILSKMENT